MEHLIALNDFLYTKPIWIGFGVFNFILHFWFTHGFHAFSETTNEELITAVIMSLFAASMGVYGSILLVLSVVLLHVLPERRMRRDREKAALDISETVSP